MIDARGAEALEVAREELAARTETIAIPGDVNHEAHRKALIDAAGPELDLLVNNASVLGPSPLPDLASYPIDELAEVLSVNTLAR